MEKDLGEFVECGFVLPTQINYVRRAVRQLCAAVRPDAVALVDAFEEGEIKGGEVAVFTAVGAGLSWGACAVRLGKRTTPINTSDAKLPDFDGKAVDTIRRAIEYQIPDKLDLI